MKRYKFEAAIQPGYGWGAFVIFPHSTLEEFGIRGRVPVQALFGGLPYTGSLMPTGAGFHRLSVPRCICEQLGKAAGNLIGVVLWRDDLPRTVLMPEGFVRLLKMEKLLAAFETLTVSRRKEYRNWITSAMKDETRLRRMNKAIKMLRAEVTTAKAKSRA